MQVHKQWFTTLAKDNNKNTDKIEGTNAHDYASNICEENIGDEFLIFY